MRPAAFAVFALVPALLGSAAQSHGAPAGVPAVVAKYAPLVRLAANEDKYPASVQGYFLANSSLRFVRSRRLLPDKHTTVAPRGAPAQTPDRLGAATSRPWTFRRNNRTYRASDFTRPHDTSNGRNGLGTNDGFYLDLANDHHGGDPNLGNDPVYYEYVHGRYVTYWFFYAYDVGIVGFNHEGDWEHVSVKLDGSDHAVELATFRHDCHYDPHGWRAVPKAKGTQHPIVYVARRSHGTYAATSLGSKGTCHSGLHDSIGNGPTWKTWTRLEDARAEPWYGFGGGWGQDGDSVRTTGPLGPSRYKSPSPY